MSLIPVTLPRPERNNTRLVCIVGRALIQWMIIEGMALPCTHGNPLEGVLHVFIMPSKLLNFITNGR